MTLLEQFILLNQFMQKIVLHMCYLPGTVPGSVDAPVNKSDTVNHKNTLYVIYLK